MLNENHLIVQTLPWENRKYKQNNFLLKIYVLRECQEIIHKRTIVAIWKDSVPEAKLLPELLFSFDFYYNRSYLEEHLF